MLRQRGLRRPMRSTREPVVERLQRPFQQVQTPPNGRLGTRVFAELRRKDWCSAPFLL